ncbi:hypothetical protein [Streptomyces sp. NPDC059863]|uniref:hypothetical protein n=1 Tax=unclassified Streptomyces TaxID=2593676 RepID=UPI0036485155
MMSIALDAPTLALADAIGADVSPLGRTGLAIGAEALALVSDYNTKAGFRPATAGHRHAATVRPRLRRRSAPHSRPNAGPIRPRLVFDGRMGTLAGTFTGYRLPLPGGSGTGVRDELTRSGLALGDLLMAQGYARPYEIDALLGEDSRQYATESIRRTATTTPHALVDRLASGNGRTDCHPAWLMATTMPRVPLTFPQALARCATRPWRTKLRGATAPACTPTARGTEARGATC